MTLLRLDSAHITEMPVPQTPSTPSAPAFRPVTLIANDQEWSARSIESVLAPRGLDVRRAFTGTQAMALAFECRPHLIILDAQMSDHHGFDVCRMLREDPRIGRTTPIFVTTSGPAGRKERLAAYKAGVWEFFPEPLDLEIFLARIETALESSLAVRELESSRHVDPETGLYSVEGLDHRARQLQAEAARQQQPVSCVVIRAETTNTSDESADQQRLEMSRAVRRVSRESDAVGEFGPGEYAIVAAGVNQQRAASLLERYRGAIAQLGVIRDGTMATIAAGVATMLPTAASRVDFVTPVRFALERLRRSSATSDATFEFSIN